MRIGSENMRTNANCEHLKSYQKSMITLRYLYASIIAYYDNNASTLSEMKQPEFKIIKITNDGEN